MKNIKVFLSENFQFLEVIFFFYIFELACFRDEFKSALVNQPLVFESLKLYCIPEHHRRHT